MFRLLRLPNLRLLFVAQALGASASPFNTLLGGIVGTRLAPDPRLATLPVALVVVGIAAGTVPVVAFMRRFGRRAGFLASAAVAIAGALVAAFAIHRGAFWLFCAATPLLGLNLAAVQQVRFAAAENVAADEVPRAVSLVLVSTLVAAFLGPWLAQLRVPFAGMDGEAAAYVVLAGVLVISLLVMLAYTDVHVAEGGLAGGEARPLSVIVAQPRFVVAALSSAVGYAVMSLLMTATPIAMHVHDHHALHHTGGVIQAHIVAMFLPSLFAGALIRRFGEVKLILAGIAINVGCVVAAALGRTVPHYGVALVLLGVGWNFLFVGGTSLLTLAYRPAERFRAQAANDFLVFSSTAVASLLSGAAVHAAGWSLLVLGVLPPLALLLVIVAAGRGRLQPA